MLMQIRGDLQPLTAVYRLLELRRDKLFLHSTGPAPCPRMASEQSPVQAQETSALVLRLAVFSAGFLSDREDWTARATCTSWRWAYSAWLRDAEIRFWEAVDRAWPAAA